MMRLRRASACCALLLLASAATAYAECAWVLWSLNVPTGVEKWKPEMGFKDAESCQQTLISPEKLSPMSLPWPDIAKVEVNNNTAMIYYKDSRRASASLRCFPDTVDPRGPKGK